jgi:hypothetical protein
MDKNINKRKNNADFNTKNYREKKSNKNLFKYIK